MSRSGTRIEGANGWAVAMWPRWESFAGAVAARVPPPPSVVEPLRAALATELLAERADEIAAAREAAARGLAGEGGAPGLGGLAELAEGLVAELRARVADRARGMFRLAAALDARLPTDAVEWMDRPGFPSRDALVGELHAWNRRFGNYDRYCSAVEPVLRAGDTVLDVASGHGGFARALRARRPDIRVLASDAVAPGDADARRIDARDLSRELRPGEVDVITCTAALHHFGAGGAALLLAQARARARAVVIVDLSRSPDRLAAAALAAAAGGREPGLLHDTVVSFRRAFTPAELRLVAALTPGPGTVEVGWWAPGFVVLRAR